MTYKQTISKKIELTVRDKIVSAVILAAWSAAAIALPFIRTSITGGAGFDMTLPAVYLYAAAILALAGALWLALINYMREAFKRHKFLILICLVLFINTVLCAAFQFLSALAMPVCIAAVVTAHLLDTRLAFVCNLVSIIQVMLYMLLLDVAGQIEGGFSTSILPLTIGLLFGSAAVFQLGKNVTRLQFIGRLSGATAAVFPLALLYELLYRADMSGVWQLLMYIALAALLQITLSLLFVFILEYAFNLLTNDRLSGFCDYNRPLLKRLAAEAPATFNHSQIVSNFAEGCASAIGENVYMARAAALYHDIGKLENIDYFTENQRAANPHDNITPELSAEIICKHTTDGFKMATKARLPYEIAIITREHHGTMPIAYFLDKAKKMTDGEINTEMFLYKGPLPSTKIAAIIMICDSSEAAIRATNDGNKIDGIVRGIINERLLNGQFDNCGITMQELAIIRQTIVNFSPGVTHKRIQYPNATPLDPKPRR
jgi:putative nucleotidyltransferase with HDIG domain